MDRKEAINVLKGIIATNDSYAYVRAKISKDHSDTSWIDYVVLIEAESGDLDILKLAHLAGGDLEAKNNEFDEPPAHFATMGGHLSCLEYLAKQGVDLQEKDEDGLTPAHYAAGEGHLPCLQFLAEQGVNLEADDNGGHTPVHDAAWEGHLSCLKYLAEKGVDLQAKNKDGQTPSDLAYENNHTDIVNFIDTFLAEKSTD